MINLHILKEYLVTQNWSLNENLDTDLVMDLSKLKLILNSKNQSLIVRLETNLYIVKENPIRQNRSLNWFLVENLVTNLSMVEVTLD